MCGALRASDSGRKAVLMGWVNRRRDHGNLLFLDLRDRTGVTQVVINAERDAAIHEKSAALRNEYVIAVSNEETRLKYRYIDLRREVMQFNLETRHKVAKAIRDYLSAQGFFEIETPFMTRSTPEGARDYLVPSRVQPG